MLIKVFVAHNVGVILYPHDGVNDTKDDCSNGLHVYPKYFQEKAR